VIPGRPQIIPDNNILPFFFNTPGPDQRPVRSGGADIPPSCEYRIADSSNNPQVGNARATQMQATFWIKTIARTGGQPSKLQAAVHAARDARL
jgi:hypothetical protein